MPNCPTVILPIAKPATSSAVLDVDKLAAILLDPTLIYFGDDTTLVNSSGTVSSWGSLVSGGATYTTEASGRRPAYLTTSGPLPGLPYADFTATGDSSADRMLWSGATYAVTDPHTVVEVIRVDTSPKDYLDGGETGTTDIISGTTLAGVVRQKFGDATASGTIGIGQWGIVLRSWDGSGAVEVHVNGERDAQTATVQPTTARVLNMGCDSGPANAGTLDGGIALRMRFTKYIGADRDFFVNVVGAYLQERYQFSKNPIVAV